jgi:hypothetical protein
MVIHIGSPVSNIGSAEWPKNWLQVQHIWYLLSFVAGREAPKFLCTLSITCKQWHEQTRPIVSLMRENAAAVALGYPIFMVNALTLHRLSLLRLPRLKLPPGCTDGDLMEQHGGPTERFFEAVQATPGSLVRYASSDGFNKGIAIKAFDRGSVIRGETGVHCIFLYLNCQFDADTVSHSCYRWDPDGRWTPAWPPSIRGQEIEVQKVLSLPLWYSYLMVALVNRGVNATWQSGGSERSDPEALHPPRKMEEMAFQEFKNSVRFDPEDPICFLVETIPQTEVEHEPLPPSWQQKRSLERQINIPWCPRIWGLLCGFVIWLITQIKRALSF